MMGIFTALLADVFLTTYRPIAFVFALISITATIASIRAQPISFLGWIGLFIFLFGAGGFFIVFGFIALAFSGALSR
jgi:hypothetical protein